MKPGLWFDVTAKDAKRSREFYARIFGWQFNVIEGLNYALTETADSVPGGIGQAGDHTPHPPGVVAYFPVEDLDATLAAVAGCQAECLVQPWELPGYGRMAVVADPDGNRIGLWER